MRRTLVVLGVFIVFGVSAQKTTFKGEAGYRLGFHGNVYEAPEDYQKNDSVYYDGDEMLKNDFAHGFKANIDFKTKLEKKKGRLLYGYSLENLLYLEEKNGNLNEHDLSLKYLKKIKKKWSSTSGLAYTRSQKLALNALGEQLVISLAYHGYKFEQDFVRKFKKKSKIKFTGTLVHKDYDQRSNEETMTHWDYGFKTHYYKYFKKNRKFEAYGGYRFKQFTEVKNMDILNPERIDFDPITQFMADTFPDKQNWTWTYLNFGASMKFRLKKYMYLTPLLAYTHRKDISEGDFSYHSFDLGAKWKYSQLKFGFKISGKYALKNYTERLAAVPNEQFYPLLKYNVVRGKMEAYYRLKKKWYLTLDAQVVYRHSNIEVNTERTRRTYFANQALLGVKYKFKNQIKRKK